MSTSTDNPLAHHSLEDLISELERRGFGPEHIIDIREDSWGVEHPVRCRIGQLDPDTGKMRTLFDSCVVWQAFEDGLAIRLRERRGLGRFGVSERNLEGLRELLENL